MQGAAGRAPLAGSLLIIMHRFAPLHSASRQSVWTFVRVSSSQVGWPAGAWAGSPHAECGGQPRLNPARSRLSVSGACRKACWSSAALRRGRLRSVSDTLPPVAACTSSLWPI